MSGNLVSARLLLFFLQVRNSTTCFIEVNDNTSKPYWLILVNTPLLPLKIVHSVT